MYDKDIVRCVTKPNLLDVGNDKQKTSIKNSWFSWQNHVLEDNERPLKGTAIGNKNTFHTYEMFGMWMVRKLFLQWNNQNAKNRNETDDDEGPCNKLKSHRLLNAFELLINSALQKNEKTNQFFCFFFFYSIIIVSLLVKCVSSKWITSFQLSQHIRLESPTWFFYPLDSYWFDFN